VDILKARKKAAERKQERKKPKSTESPVAEPTREGPSLPAEPVPVLLVPVTESPVSATVLPANEDSAMEPPSGHEAGETVAHEIELLSFRLGEEAYAVLIKDVQEVLKVRDLTMVPNAPSYILGVASLRGTMLPVIDLCKRLGLPVGARDEKARIIVVDIDNEAVGLIVDRVTGVLRISLEEVKPTPENIAQGAEFLRGIVRKDDNLYIVLDLEKTVEA
jgi:purine-binding chemotaxis protein CheW